MNILGLFSLQKKSKLVPNKKSILFIYEFLSRIVSSVLMVNCYQRGSCVGAFNSPFEHRSRSYNIRPLDNHLSTSRFGYESSTITLTVGSRPGTIFSVRAFVSYGMLRFKKKTNCKKKLIRCKMYNT